MPHYVLQPNMASTAFGVQISEQCHKGAGEPIKKVIITVTNKIRSKNVTFYKKTDVKYHFNILFIRYYELSWLSLL